MLVAVTPCSLTTAFSTAVRHFIFVFFDTHSRHPRPHSFWLAPRIATSCRARSSEDAYSRPIDQIRQILRKIRETIAILGAEQKERVFWGRVAHMRCYDIFLVSLPTGTKFQ